MTYGFTGKLLRVNLTNGTVSVEDSSKYNSYLGGAGTGNRIIYDEVPLGTKPYDEANKVVFAVGPSTGTSAPCSGRTTITSLSTFTKGNAVVHAHIGGEVAQHMKASGYDIFIIEGKASTPVYIKIADDDVTIEDATKLWGKTTRETSIEIMKELGKPFTVTSIGLAGENMVNLACVINAANHCAGAGVGAIFGSKNLKAVAMYGTGAVHVADPAKVLQLNEYVMKDLIGANNNHVVPSTERPWAEYSHPKSRWTGRPGLTWGAAEGGPVDTGDSIPGDINTVGYRTQKSVFDHGAVAEKYTVKMTGCTSCPIRCSSTVHLPELEKEGYVSAVSNTCMPNFMWSVILSKFKDYVEEGDGKFYANIAAMSTADDLGLWDNYGELPKTIAYFIKNGYLEKILPAEEFAALRWDLYEAGDAGFIKDIMYKISTKSGEIANLALGAYFVAEKYKDVVGEDYLNAKAVSVMMKNGSSKHHGNECAAQVGALTNIFYNRDCMTHTVINIVGSGLPYQVQKRIIDGLFGEGAIDMPAKYTAMNESKAKFAKFGIVRQSLHDSFTLCNWVWPLTFSPLKARNYEGDLSVEAQYMTAVTGENWSKEKLDDAAEKAIQLLRAMTVMAYGTVDMYNEHDQFNDWVYDDDPDVAAFTEGTVKMDREDMKIAYKMMYKEMGWDEETGAPTRSTLEKFDLKDIADKLEEMNLLP
ncbi:aldehyde ferredoxin oxidoreductase [Candidatus Epulonipiscium fishelsonii]|uniref:Aldehyde ferredoxin oxidoreductase n=1 Tax=Candidatus Epulonipiscium fishelsonii TaxID=77094 RepID=A0ACC8XAR5_9FIRM|nr:aldehyde ferredoxin oxidoreductase [Epulopiscium sp. SCG-B11WGA-EpuloA1]ONI41198.1 aldehyde ferredoxin oxidoreductase [Epulopiscium sp. SCG-B05WGA-EpuloA1]